MITRRRILAGTGGIAALAAAGAAAQGANDPTQARSGTMLITRSGSQPSRKGPADWFTGAVRVDPLFQAPDPARVSGASVTFEPGARTAWHTHRSRADIGHHLGLRLGSARGWVDRGSSAGRRGVVSAWPEALARCNANDSDDAHRHSGVDQRQERRLVGARQR
jgi:hypothetical protein